MIGKRKVIMESFMTSSPSLHTEIQLEENSGGSYEEMFAKACGQVMSIVRYADDFVILARAWVDGFLKKVEGILEERMELTVNREKTKTLDFREPHTALTFLGYDFRMVRDRLFGTGKRYLTFGPSKKSMKRIREKIHGITHARNGYALRRMARFLNRKSQRHYRLKFADTYYGELNHYGMYWLRWADVRRRRY